MRRRGILLLIEILLALAILSNAQAMIDKYNYSVGDTITINLNYTDLANSRLEIINNERRYQFLKPHNIIRFIPKETGFHLIHFINNSSIIDSAEFYVGTRVINDSLSAEPKETISIRILSEPAKIILYKELPSGVGINENVEIWIIITTDKNITNLTVIEYLPEKWSIATIPDNSYQINDTIVFNISTLNELLILNYSIISPDYTTVDVFKTTLPYYNMSVFSSIEVNSTKGFFDINIDLYQDDSILTREISQNYEYNARLTVKNTGESVTEFTTFFRWFYNNSIYTVKTKHEACNILVNNSQKYLECAWDQFLEDDVKIVNIEITSHIIGDDFSEFYVTYDPPLTVFTKIFDFLKTIWQSILTIFKEPEITGKVIEEIPEPVVEEEPVEEPAIDKAVELKILPEARLKQISNYVSGIIQLDAGGSVGEILEYEFLVDDNPIFDTPEVLCATSKPVCEWDTTVSDCDLCYLQVRVSNEKYTSYSKEIHTIIDNELPEISDFTVAKSDDSLKIECEGIDNNKIEYEITIFYDDKWHNICNSNMCEYKLDIKDQEIKVKCLVKDPLHITESIKEIQIKKPRKRSAEPPIQVPEVIEDKIWHTTYEKIFIRTYERQKEIKLKSNNQIVQANLKIISKKGSKADADLELQGLHVKKIKFNDIILEDNLQLGIEDVSLSKIKLKDTLKSFAIDPTQLSFSDAIVTVTATGNKLWKCRNWDFNNQQCLGSWKLVKEITPGKEYNFLLTAQDPGYAETGIASINTKKPIYHPNATAEIIIVVLDTLGHLVSNAEVYLNITSPDNFVYEFSDIVETSRGIYEMSFYNTNLEGSYKLDVLAIANSVSNSMTSQFSVKEYYEFDIFRNTPVTIDPWQGPFVSSIHIVSYNYTGLFNFTEVLPGNFTIHNAESAQISQTNTSIYLHWINIANNSIVSYTANSPLITPELYQIGPSFINYNTKIFEEARPWYLAVDPSTDYVPTSTISQGWDVGTGTTHAEINEGRALNTSDFVADPANAKDISEFGFPPITESGITSMVLHVYTSTGSNAYYTYYLQQSGIEVCSDPVPVGTNPGWRNCTWTDPSGDLSSMTIELGGVSKLGGGAAENANVYSVYLQVFYDNPPSVNLNEPENNSIQSSNISFNFTVVDDLDLTLQNCTLWANFSGVFEQNESIFNVQNNSKTGINVSGITDGIYLWSVECFDIRNQGNDLLENFSVIVNPSPPSIDFPDFNITVINQSDTVRFNVSVTDYFGISNVFVTLKYPNLTKVNYTLTQAGEEFSKIFTDTIQLGYYNITLIEANDSYNQISQNTTQLSFQVVASPPTAFNLAAPDNNTVTANLLPNMSWQQTYESNFGNYTLIIDKDSLFSTIDFTYATYEIENISFNLTSSLDTNSIYYWKVLAYDIFGNNRNSTNYFIYITDTALPNVTLNNPPDNNYVLTSSVVFNYTPEDVNLENCTLYGNFSNGFQENQTNSSPINNNPNTFAINLADAGYLWNIECYDKAGNNNFSESNYTVLIDTYPPGISLESPPNSTLETATNNVIFKYNVSDAMTTIDNCILIIDGFQTGDPDTSIQEKVSQNFTAFVANGQHNWSINCTDSNGFMNNSVTFNLTVNVISESDPPVIQPNYPAIDDFLSLNNVLFNYTPNDASGIENCSIYINSAWNNTNTSINNNVPNYFTINNFDEWKYEWFVRCYDNSSYIAANSTARNFTIDLSNPTVNLFTPKNDTFYSDSDVLFNYTPSDTNLFNCSLYGNFSGNFLFDQLNANPETDQPNNFTKTLADGSYKWNVLCYDKAKRNTFSPVNYTVKVDATYPGFDNASVQPGSPSDYSPSLIIKYNVTVIDTFLDTVWIEHNFSRLQNYSVNFSINNVFYYNITYPAAGGYVYRWYANDSTGKINSTQQYTYIVNKDASRIHLLVNGTDGNISILEDAVVNISAFISTPSTGIIEIYLNSTLINNGSTPLQNLTLFSEPGLYNITAIYPQTENYTFDFETHFISVNDTTNPNVSLMLPIPNATIGTSSVTFTYSVTDSGPIINCSLYINGTLNLTEPDITTNTTETFQQIFSDGNYSWQVRCYDNSNNLGISEIRNFSVLQSNLVINVTTNKYTYVLNEQVNVSALVTDKFDNIVNANLTLDLIKGNTSVNWWNTSWKKRKPIFINETQGINHADELIELNLTGLNVSSCVNEIRIIHNRSTEFLEVPVKILFGDSSSCFVQFRGNLSESAVNENNYYVYYNNSQATNPNYGVNTSATLYFNAELSGLDEGSPRFITNIIGKYDNTNATMSVSGGGAASESAHGLAFINFTRSDIITQVQVRYRYDVPVLSTGSWALRYSVNDGGAYANSFFGSGTQTKTTSNWDDITSDYAALTWNELNRTRLQGRVTKPGGGGTVTLDLYWVEIRVLINLSAQINDTSVGKAEEFIYRIQNETGDDGIIKHGTNNISVGNYSAVGLGSTSGFSNVVDATNFEVIIDIEKPSIVLNYPPNEANFSGPLNIKLNWTTLDNSPLILLCNVTVNSVIQNPSPLYISNDTPQVYSFNAVNGFYTWNVTCWDNATNINTSYSRNFTVIESPDLINITVSNDNLSVSINWSVVQYSDSYNIYISTNYSNFPSIPNATVTDLNWTDAGAFDTIKRYYKVEAVKGNATALSNGTVGKHTVELLTTWNLISIPFNLTDWLLFDGSNGRDIFTQPNNCIDTLWRYNSSNQSYQMTEYTGVWSPGIASSNFVSLEHSRGYWAEVNQGCNLTFFGVVPTENTTLPLDTEFNLMSHYSAKSPQLGDESVMRTIDVQPEDAVDIILRYNNLLDKFEVTVHVPGYGWIPSYNNLDFTYLDSMRGYYFDVDELANYTHDPNKG